MDPIVRHIVTVLPAFSLACLALAMAPGPAMALMLQRTLRDGRRAGLATIVGTEIGGFAWNVAGGAGLTVLLQANRMLFNGMRLAGAVVLIALGVSAWRSSSKQTDVDFDPTRATGAPGRRGPRAHGAAFRASLLSIAANPKAALFSFSFFPQFLPAEGPLFLTTVWLSLIQVAIEAACCVGLVLIAARARDWFLAPTVRRRLDRILGTILIALGIDLAVESR